MNYCPAIISLLLGVIVGLILAIRDHKKKTLKMISELTDAMEGRR